MTLQVFPILSSYSVLLRVGCSHRTHFLMRKAGPAPLAAQVRLCSESGFPQESSSFGPIPGECVNHVLLWSHRVGGGVRSGRHRSFALIRRLWREHPRAPLRGPDTSSHFPATGCGDVLVVRDILSG